MFYINIINKYKELCSRFNISIDVKLTYDNSPIQEIKDNTIYLNIDLISAGDFKTYLAYNV